MDTQQELKYKYNIEPITINTKLKNESYLTVKQEDFIPTCLALHKLCASPVMLMFAEDKRSTRSCYRLNTAFFDAKQQHWYYACLDFPENKLEFPSVAKEIYSASLFEREIWEMFGIKPEGSPDPRRLRLHEEVWPKDHFPLRKDFVQPSKIGPTDRNYDFIKGEGEGLFEVPVGPVHAGIIGPGHFRFSVAGEPIINLEIRLGFTHRGIEKLMEGKSIMQALELSECVSGDSVFAHSWAFCSAIEKIQEINISPRALLLRAIYLELERMYNHANDIGGIALDVGFSFASAFASIMKETIHQINFDLTKNRYLKGVNCIGGVTKDLDPQLAKELLAKINALDLDIKELEKILLSSASFMNRVKTTGILRKNTAQDLGIVGLVGRASGLTLDLRTDHEPYRSAGFKPIVLETGDAFSRLQIRFMEFKRSTELINSFLGQLLPGELIASGSSLDQDFGLGAIEGWRGPILYWIKLDQEQKIERCKIVDPSFHNWQGLTYAVKGEIIPDFPLCNKSFDLSYSGNDL